VETCSGLRAASAEAGGRAFEGDGRGVWLQAGASGSSLSPRWTARRRLGGGCSGRVPGTSWSVNPFQQDSVPPQSGACSLGRGPSPLSVRPPLLCPASTRAASQASWSSCYGAVTGTVPVARARSRLTLDRAVRGIIRARQQGNFQLPSTVKVPGMATPKLIGLTSKLGVDQQPPRVCHVLISPGRMAVVVKVLALWKVPSGV
jgi:hypothetical protein